MRMGVIGGGTVGRATARCYMEWGEVRVHDVLPQRSTHSLAETMGSDVVFVCLPTPAGPDRLAAIEAFCALIAGCGTPLALRSTVPVGTTDALRQKYSLPNLVHHPEFLTARCANTDAQLPARNVAGGPLEGRGPKLANSRGLRVLSELLLARFDGTPLHLVSARESELIKLATNAFFATKIAFMNELRCVSDAAGCHWQSVVNAVLADGRISHSHAKVPGPDGLFGFGGDCLVKDSQAFADSADALGTAAPVVRAALARNEWDRQRGAT